MSQHHIGCAILFRGFLRTSWTLVVSMPHHPSRRRDPEQGDRMPTTIITSLSENAAQLWKRHNELLHQYTVNTHRAAAKTLNIATIFHSNRTCLPGDRHLFHPPRLKHSNSQPTETRHDGFVQFAVPSNTHSNNDRKDKPRLHTISLGLPRHPTIPRATSVATGMASLSKRFSVQVLQAP